MWLDIMLFLGSINSAPACNNKRIIVMPFPEEESKLGVPPLPDTFEERFEHLKALIAKVVQSNDNF